MWKLQLMFAFVAEFFETNYSFFEIYKFRIIFGLWRRVIFFRKHSFKLVFALCATKFRTRHKKSLAKVWNCREFLGVQKNILNQITYFWGKIINSDPFSDFFPKFSDSFGGKFHQGCKNCVKHDWRNFFRKQNVCLRYNCAFIFVRILAKISRSGCRKCILRVQWNIVMISLYKL